MVSATNGLTGGNNSTTFSWNKTYRSAVATGNTYNATLSSATLFSGSPWIAKNVNVYGPGTYTFDTNGGGTYTMTVADGQSGAHMLFDWGNAAATPCGKENCDIDVVVLWDMNKSWADTGTSSPMLTSATNTTTKVWDGVSIDTSMDPDDYSGTKMIDGPFVGQSANFSVMGIAASVAPITGTISPATTGCSTLSAAFSKPVTGVDASTFTLTQGGAPVAGAVSGSGTSWTFTPASPLGNSTTYVATLASSGITATEAVGVPVAAQTWALFGGANITFTTAPSCDFDAPTAPSVAPATGQAPTAPITITFSEPMDPSTVNTTTFTLIDGSSNPVAGTITTSDNTTFVFVPTVPLSGLVSYTASVSVGAKDLGGNPLSPGAKTWPFTTAANTSQSASGTVTGTVTVSVSLGSGSIVSLTVEPAGNLGGTPPVDWEFGDAITYAIDHVIASPLMVTLTFSHSITGRTLYKVKNGVYRALTEGVDYTKTGDATITIAIADNDGTNNTNGFDTDTTAGRIVDPIVDGVYVPPAVLGAAGGGGGCVLDPRGGKDASLILALLVVLGYVGWRRSDKK